MNDAARCGNNQKEFPGSFTRFVHSKTCECEWERQSDRDGTILALL